MGCCGALRRQESVHGRCFISLPEDVSGTLFCENSTKNAGHLVISIVTRDLRSRRKGAL